MRRPVKIGIGGPEGSGKTALVDRLCKAMRDQYERKRAVIGFRHVTAITIVRGEHTSLAITERSEAFGQRAIDNFDINIRMPDQSPTPSLSLGAGFGRR